MAKKLLICKRIPCYYYFLLILATLLEECKTSLSKEQLLGATRIIMNSLDNDEFREIYEELDMHLTFKYDDLEREFQEFLTRYAKFISFQDGVLGLQPNVSYDDILEEMEIIEDDEDFYSFASEIRLKRKLKSLKEYLGLDYLRNIYLKLIAKEERVEKHYLNGAKNNLLWQERLRKLFDLRSQLYKKLAIAGIPVIKALQDEEEVLQVNFQDFPIDLALYKESEFFDDNFDLDDDDGSIEDNLRSLYQIAIFTSKDLAEVRLSNDLSLLRWKLYDNDANFLSETLGMPYDSDIIFYLTYLEKLEELKSLYQCPNLEITKDRLLYALDTSSLELFEETNRSKVLKAMLSDAELTPIFASGFKYLRNESLFFIEDLFQGKKQAFPNMLKKVAFIASYYELSKDDLVKKVLFRYTSCPSYLEIYRFIVSANAKTK